MTMGRFLAGAVFVVALVVGGGSTAVAGQDSTTPANCVGQHVSTMAREHGGMAAATAHHNEMHGTDLGVGEHQAHVRAEECGR